MAFGEPWWRHVADAGRVALVAGVPIVLITSGPKAAYAMALLACVAVALRWVRAPAQADAVFVVLLALDGWLTALNAFASFNRNDTIGHVLLPAAVTPLLHHLLTRHPAHRLIAVMSASRAASLLVLGALTLTLGVAWEITEWLSDAALGTDMSLGYADTMSDLTADAFGALLGALATSYLIRRRSLDVTRLRSNA